MESLLRATHRAGNSMEPLCLRLQSREGMVGLAVELPDQMRTLFLQELQDAYPGTTVQRIRNSDKNDVVTVATWLRLQPDVYRMRTYDEFLDVTDARRFSDPLGSLLAAIRTGHSGRLECCLELSLQPAREQRLRAAQRIARRLQRGFATPSLGRCYTWLAMHDRWCCRLAARLVGRLTRTGPARDMDISNKLNETLFASRLRVTVTTTKDGQKAARRKLEEVVATLGRFHQAAAFQTLKTKKPPRWQFLMSAAEIATLWHPLTASGDAVSRMQRSEFRELEPPVVLTSRKGSGEQTVLGRVRYRQQRNQFGIATDDLRRHLLAIGKTGCGKSTFLFNLVRQQMDAGRGVVLIDPHGQLAEEVLDVVPRRRTNETIYFDASDSTAPVGFNPMVGPAGTDPTLIADSVLTSFKNVFGFDAASAPRLLHIFRNSLLSLIGSPDASLAQVQRLLVDASFRKTVIARQRNPAVREFWLTEFNRWNERDRTQYVASLQNKLGAFTTNQRLRAILDCGQQGIHLREVMDRSRILICNLSKGTFGHDASTLLGSLLLSSLQVAAMSRADNPEAERRDCVIVVDEFHSYLSTGNSTMADALAESRKYRTSYVLSTQMLEQLDHDTLAGVLGNCGSTLCMTVGPRDAEILAGLLSNGLTPDDLLRIPKYHAYLRLLVAGMPYTFSMTTLSPPKYIPRRASTVRKVSRSRFGQAS